MARRAAIALRAHARLTDMHARELKKRKPRVVDGPRGLRVYIYDLYSPMSMSTKCDAYREYECIHAELDLLITHE